MKREKQISILKELMRQLDEKVNVDAGVQYRNPASSYTCKELAAKEWKTFFQNHPQIIGLSGDLPEPGSYLTIEDFGVPVLATRDNDGQFHAFLNGCRHRGVQVASEPRGKAHKFMCPFHNWTYSNQGNLVNIPRSKDFGDIDKSCHGLVELPAQEKHGLLVVHPNPEGGFEIDDLLGDLAPEIAGWNFDSLVYHTESVLDNQLNWKLANDTFGETYHFSRLHKNTLGHIFHGDALAYEEYGRNHRFVFATKNIETLKGIPEEDWQYGENASWLYYLFPNVQLGGGGHDANLIKIYPDPNNPGRSITKVNHYFSQEFIDYVAQVPDDGKGAYERERNPSLDAVVEVFDSTIEQEDYLMGETTQKSAETGIVKEFIFGRNEPALHHYHNTFREALDLPPLEKVG